VALAAARGDFSVGSKSLNLQFIRFVVATPILLVVFCECALHHEPSQFVTRSQCKVYLLEEEASSNVLKPENVQKATNEDETMRLIVLATVATVGITSGVMASETTKHVKKTHYRDANASIAAEGSVPADILSAHDLHMLNLRDSGLI
jgi:hypothetical protein